MNNELEHIKKLPTTKHEIALFSERIIEALESGEVNALEVLRHFKAFEKIAEGIKPTLDKLALAEAEKYPEKTFELYGVKFTVKNAPAIWDYTKCNDGLHSKLKEYQAEYNEKVKQRENFLQSLTESMEMVDEDSGEVIRINPANKSQKTLVQTNFQ